MTTNESFAKRRPVLSYYLLTFAISWGALLWIMISDGIPATKEQMAAVLPVAIASMLLGPSLSGLLMTALVDGKAGFRELGSRLAAWRVRLGWYAIAILFAPLVLLAVLLGLALFSPVFLPGILTVDDKAARLTMNLTAAVAVGICEELGWTGFVMPRLMQRYTVVRTGLIMGVLWGAWHIVPMVILASGAYSAPQSPAVYIAARSLSMLVGSLVAFRVLMVWVYDHTRSLFLLMIMHMSLTAVNMLYEPEAISGTSLYIYDLVGLLAMWSVTLAVVRAARGKLVALSPTAPAQSTAVAARQPAPR